MKRRGTTLVELLVAVAVFGVALSVVLGFYGPAIKASQRRERDSTQFRRAVETLSKLEAMIRPSKFVEASNDHILFLEPQAPPVLNGFPNWKNEATLVFIVEKKLMLHRDGSASQMLELEDGEDLNFRFQEWRTPPTPSGNELLVLEWIYTGPPEKNLDFNYNRMISLEHY